MITPIQIGSPTTSISAAGIMANTVPHQGTGAGSAPSAAQQLQGKPVPFSIARQLLEREHYLHSFPGGTKLAFGAFVGTRLLGALTLGAGPANAYCLVNGATSDDCLTLTRLWLSDKLPKNSESRFLGIVIRALKRNTSLKFLVSYADPAQGHLGTIYQATGWTYTGLSQATPLYDIGDGRKYHSRSLSHSFGSHGLAHFQRHGINVKLVPQESKHRYLYFLDPTWRARLRLPVLAYHKQEESSEDN
jgi:hypothetical protein